MVNHTSGERGIARTGRRRSGDECCSRWCSNRCEVSLLQQGIPHAPTEKIDYITWRASSPAWGSLPPSKYRCLCPHKMGTSERQRLGPERKRVSRTGCVHAPKARLGDIATVHNEVRAIEGNSATAAEGQCGLGKARHDPKCV